MIGGIEDTFNSALCCYLNMLYLKGRYYAPAKIFISPLAGSILRDPTPKGYDKAFHYLRKSHKYVRVVTQSWKLHECKHCEDTLEPRLDSFYFTHTNFSRRCDDICIECGRHVKTCLECNHICKCCEYNWSLVVEVRRQHPADFFTNCITNSRNLKKMKAGSLEARCCAKHYHLFDDMTKMYWLEHCEVCKDRVDCLLIRS